MARETHTAGHPAAPLQDRIQRRHTIAAVVYFLYGIFYLFGAQYLTSMQQTQRGMSNPEVFFVLGGVITVVFPLLIYRRLALGLSVYWRAQRQTLSISFTLLLGVLVLLRVLALLRGGVFTKTWLHTAALVVAAINATCLIWAGWSRPVWVTRAAEEPSALSGPGS